jgi:hypothetical protein
MVAPWQELYKLTEYWKEEQAFYEEEFQFYDNLVTLYEGPDGDAPELRQLLNDTRLQERSLMNQADTHLAHLGKVVGMPTTVMTNFSEKSTMCWRIISMLLPVLSGSSSKSCLRP